MNRYVRSSIGGELPVASLDVDAAITCPAEVTLDQVEQLGLLEPYGAGNARPVFALLGATVDSVQSVGQGKHLKLRLSRGSCRFDAIFFSVTAEDCRITAGSRVDAAFYLQANTFRGATTLQLQLIDLRPSLTPSRHEAADLELVQRLMNGGELTPQESTRLRMSRDQFAALWTALEPAIRQGKTEVETLPYLRQLGSRFIGSDGFLRAALALEVFRERGLISLTSREDTLTLCLNPTQGKVDLFACPYLNRLRITADANRGESI